MAVARLKGENLRLYRSLEIEPHPQLNLIVGDNASGKTTFLESLYVPARGRSFRATNLSELCGSHQPGWTVFLEIRAPIGGHRIGIGWSREGTRLRMDEERGARLADVIRAIPMQLIDPLAHRLLDEGPAYRRSYIDWGVFHVEHRFHDIWRRFQRALQQRNRALRDQADARSVNAFNEELATTAEAITAFRERHVVSTAPGLASWAERLLGDAEVRSTFQRGWPAGEDYRETLSRNLEQHQRLGTTVQGPHRAELRIDLGPGRAKGRASRGQQKLLVAAMILAQSELLIAAGVSAPILLLDDFSAELSPESQARFARHLVEYPGQKFITSFEPVPAFFDHPARLFHVEQGTIRAVDGFAAADLKSPS